MGLLLGSQIIQVIAGPSGFVDMSTAETVIHENLGNSVAAKVSFETDGTVHDYGPLANTDNGKMTAGEWWSEEPQVGIGSSYDVREDVHFQDVWFYVGASLDVWIQMNLDRKWGYRRLAMASPGVTAGYGTFEIRITGSGTYIDRQNYAVQVTN